MADPTKMIRARAQEARRLFEEGGATREREPVPHTVSPPPPGVPHEPWRSTVTTTIARQTAASTRAMALHDLAGADLVFFDERALLSSSQLRRAIATIDALERFLEREATQLRTHAERNVELVQEELELTRSDLRWTRAALARTEAQEEQTVLAARANLLLLGRARLERLLGAATAVSEYMGGIRGAG